MLKEYEVEYHLDAQDYGLEKLSPVSVRVVPKKFGNKYELTINIGAKYSICCSRCLKELDFELDTTIVRIASNRVTNEEEIEIKNQEYMIDDAVFDEIGLLLPHSVLCDEECKGLCPSCGQDFNVGDCDCSKDNIDPRFKELAKLIK